MTDERHASDPQSRPSPQLPRDAASLVIVDRGQDQLRFLLGQRRSSQVFVPNKYVFPGGRVDPSDADIDHDGALASDALHNLMYDMKGAASPQRAKALALAALRETYEEAGILFASPLSTDTKPGMKTTWPAFEALGLRPNLNGMSFFARAITPPGRPRRYDTRFFTIDASLITSRLPPPDDELRNLKWFTLEDLADLDLLNITQKILSDLVVWDQCQGNGHQTPQVPYYFFKQGSFHRVLVPRAQSAC
ncbi:MAG: NUDIX hydrolase [Hyphomicrobiaceae bacterium]